MAPNLGGTVDSAEFQQAAYSLGIAHPTGYPLYLMVARAWISIFPFGDPAFRVTLLSAIFGALSVWVVFATVRYATRSIYASFVAALIFAVHAIPWAQAGVAEINTLNNLLTALAFLACLRWAGGDGSILLFALMYGLAVSHHRTALLYAPLLLIFALTSRRRAGSLRESGKRRLVSVTLFLLPFAAYIYLPLRAATNPSYPNSWAGFWGWALGESAFSVIEGALQRPLLGRFNDLLATQFWGWPGRIFFALGVAGVLWALFLIRRSSTRRGEGEVEGRAILLYAAAALVGTAFATVYDILDVTDYLGVPLFMWSVAAGAGVVALLSAFSCLLIQLRLPNIIRRWAVALILIGFTLIPLFSAVSSLGRSDVRVDWSQLDRRAYWQQIEQIETAIPSGAFLVAGWSEYNEALYLQRAEKWRPDLTLVVLDAAVVNEAAQIKEWLEQERLIYLVGSHEAVLTRFRAESIGPLWHLTGERASGPPPAMSHTLNWTYGTAIRLLGYTIEPAGASLTAGGLLELTLFWEATAKVPERLVVFNHIIDARGGKVGQKDGEPNSGNSPTVSWRPGETVIDRYLISIAPGTTPGKYRLMTGLYPRIGDRKVTAFDEVGSPLGDYPELAVIEIR